MTTCFVYGQLARRFYRSGAGFVCDTSALGEFYVGPLAFGTFEESAGSTNTSTVRVGSSGLFVCQRPEAAATLAGGS